MWGILDSFPALASNTPPLVSTLISSLNLYHASKVATTSLPESRFKLLPLEVAHMVCALKEMRPAEAKLPIPSQEGNYGQCGDGYEEQHGDFVDHESLQDGSPAAILTVANVEHLMDERIRELESRLINYVDAKFNEVINLVVRGSKMEDLSEQES